MGTLLTPIQHFRDFELQHAWPTAMWKHQRVFLITPREYFDPPICCIFFSLLMGYGFFCPAVILLPTQSLLPLQKQFELKGCSVMRMIVLLLISCGCANS